MTADMRADGTFELVSEFEPAGDQPQAIAELVEGLDRGDVHQTLLGVTGSGKTFTIASVVEKLNRPTLVMSPNKTLAAQLYAEMKELFPKNAVEYFVSYYDYYQPEAYIPSSDTYIEKDSGRPLRCPICVTMVPRSPRSVTRGIYMEGRTEGQAGEAGWRLVRGYLVLICAY